LRSPPATCGGRKLRTFLTTLAIVFGAWLIFGINILMPTMLKAFEANMLAASGQVDVTITQRPARRSRATC
jgi:putative ABC transport system permease protein